MVSNRCRGSQSSDSPCSAFLAEEAVTELFQSFVHELTEPSSLALEVESATPRGFERCLALRPVQRHKPVERLLPHLGSRI